MPQSRPIWVHLVGADDSVRPDLTIDIVLCLRRLVLASSISLAPPQAAGLVHSAARPLQNANAGAGLHFGSIRQKDPLETPISALARGLFIRPIRAQV